MKKSFKTLAVFLSAITLISNLSPVRAKKNFDVKENFILRHVPNSEEKLRRMQMLELREAELQRLRMAEEGLSAEEAELRREEYEETIIEVLENISTTSNNYSYDFTFNIPREPITRENIENVISGIQQYIQSFEAGLFPTGQNRFTLREFIILFLVSLLDNFKYNNKHDFSRSEVILLLCILNLEISEAIEADTVTISFYRNRLKTIFSLEGTVNHEFTLVIMQ